jgi:hypothetical protein
MSSEESTSKPIAGNEESTNTTPTVEMAHAGEARPSDTTSAAQQSPANAATSLNSGAKPMPQKSTATAKPAITAKPVTPPKPAADKASTPAPPVEFQPSLPVSMIERPDSASASGRSLIPDELEESFESALARVELAHARNSFAARILGGIRQFILSGAGRRSESVRRAVAFDGFRNDLFEDKSERDRRYGTVYSVSEEVNAFLVRLELPRRMPQSSLKQTWQLPDEMPDYACTLSLTDNVLCVRAGLPDQARRRLSYVSSSFPSDFQTRIEFHTAVEGYKHRLRNKVLEIVVYKKPGVSLEGKSQRQQLQN